MGKKTKSKAGGDFWDEDPELQDQAEELGTPAADSQSAAASPAPESDQAPEEGNMEEEFASGGLMGALRRSKKKKDDKEAEEAEAKAAAAAKNEPVVQVKSKKEKEKEKKEREKAKKRAAAQRKMTAPNAKKKDDADADASETPEPESGDADADAGSSTASKSAASEDASKGGKKKKLNPALAALQKQIAAKKAAEEARAAAAEEDQRRAKEEEQRIAEEQAKLEEARAAKRERERKKKEELRAQGKLLTKKQKEQAALQARRREQLLASGNVQVAGLMKGKPAASQAKKPSPAPKSVPEQVATPEESPESTPEPVAETTEPVAEADSKSVAEPTEAVVESDEEALMDDWEAGLSDNGGDEGTDDTNESADEPKEAESAASAATASAPKKAAVSKTAAADDGNILSHPSQLDEAKRKEIHRREEARHAKAVAAASESNLRSPICAILGHVDTGKTKLLDNMRKTNVQEGEAGGITQQIGATYFPIDAIKKKTEVMSRHVTVQYNVPGLLVIDTPGHESFSNLRSRGSSLCNIAILVVDLMHGLEPQTLESIRLLRDGKTPFVVALNKIDRLYGWKDTPNNSFRESLALQSTSVQREFEDRLEKTKLAFAEQGFNSELYFKNKNIAKNVSLIPTSAITGEGVPDLIYLLLELTQSRMSKQLMYLSELEATILEVKVIDGLGTTIDVVLSNGVLNEGDRVVLCGQNGPIATNVRALLTPQPMREMRIKGQYVHHKSVKAALGVKIAAEGLQEAVAGSRLLRVGPDDDEEELMNEVMDDVASLLDHVDKSGMGVCVQASTLGSLEALLDFLKSSRIPVMSINIGPVFKRDVMRAVTMLEKKKEYAVMLCFDVPVDREAERFANENGIKIFSANIIYHLFDEFTLYQQQLLEQRRKDNIHEAVFPCVLHIIQVINKRNPMIIGVDIIEGSIRAGTPICIVKTDPATGQKVVYNLGRIQSLEVDHKSKDIVRKGQANAGVAMRLDAGNATNMPTWGRQIDEKDNLYSLLSRKSIDVLKDPAFRDDVPRDDWMLIKKLKPLFDIK